MENKMLIILLVFVSMGFLPTTQEIEKIIPKYDQLPLTIEDVKPLRELVDKPFEQKFLAELNKNKKWKRLIEQKKMAVGLVDLRDPAKAKYARVNGNVMMYAASLPKIAVLLAAEDAMEKGEMEETDEIKSDLRLMISKSDNAAATRMIDRLGYEKIENVLTDPRYDLYDEDYGGGLWVGKRYAKLGERYPDPIKGLSHAATVSQVCRYYYMLAYGKLVSYERSKVMLEMMVSPDLHHKFVNTLDKVEPKAKLFRKSGTWKNFHTDSVLVWGPEGKRYILVALIEDPEGEMICRQLVTTAETVLKN
ncbi:MAG: class A beta-lactamase-related serine hydrolase [Bacteroidales bacterium]|nr:class A beta-lactamase-related serine hydrolase [Bacteroidales bacterium]MCF8402639.1 class A beta-lactamase-related serine hydrolase [Bacteroidales bacterium]